MRHSGRQSIPVCDFADFQSEDAERRARFIQEMGDALKDIGFFALENHGIPLDDINSAYSEAKDFFTLDGDAKSVYEQKDINRQRGFTGFGVEHAKGNPAPDLKEFWQTGRVLGEEHPSFASFPQNIWPTEDCPDFEQVVDGLFKKMEGLAQFLLSAASEYLSKEVDWLPLMANDGNTILRLIHYPPVPEDADSQSVRSAAHEDINLITLLVGATADGLEVMDHDGGWIQVEANHNHIIVDSGDMLQNLTNGLFKSTTHRVVNPDNSRNRRFSMPMFVHPRDKVDLTPDEELVSVTGGEALYDSITAGEYLYQRLVEIGLTS